MSGLTAPLPKNLVTVTSLGVTFPPNAVRKRSRIDLGFVESFNATAKFAIRLGATQSVDSFTLEAGSVGLNVTWLPPGDPRVIEANQALPHSLSERYVVALVNFQTQFGSSYVSTLQVSPRIGSLLRMRTAITLENVTFGSGHYIWGDSDLPALTTQAAAPTYAAAAAEAGGPPSAPKKKAPAKRKPAAKKPAARKPARKAAPKKKAPSRKKAAPRKKKAGGKKSRRRR